MKMLLFASLLLLGAAPAQHSPDACLTPEKTRLNNQQFTYLRVTMR